MSGRAVKVPSYIGAETYESEGGNTVLEYFGEANEGFLVVPVGGSITISPGEEEVDAIVTWQAAKDQEAEDRYRRFRKKVTG